MSGWDWKGPHSGAALDIENADEKGIFDEDRYRPGGLLGRGGMGEVTAVFDARMDRDIAMKAPRRADARTEARLIREARLTARLEHPGIVPVYDLSTDERGRPCYTMRLLRGRSLAEVLDETPDLNARLSTLRHIVSACEAVGFAHDHGVLHRDLKPANLMVGDYGELLVVDWGLACEVDADGLGPAESVGTRGYIAPELARGQAPDRRADVWSLGAVLHDVLTGAAPDTPLTFPEAVPAELAAITRRALADDPSDRYDGALALAADLQAWFEGRRIAAYHTTPWRTARQLAWTWRAPLSVAAFGAFALVLAVAWGWSGTLAERNLALAAEAEAQAARLDADRALGQAQLEQARTAEAAGDALTAVQMAREALRRLPNNPDAHGVLARFGGRPTPALLDRLPLRGCRSTRLGPMGTHVVCRRPQQVEVHDLDSGDHRILEGRLDVVGLAGPTGAVVGIRGERPLWWTQVDGPPAVVAEDIRATRVLDGAVEGRVFVSGRGHAWRIEGTTVSKVAVCAPQVGPNLIGDHASGVFAALCGGRQVVVADQRFGLPDDVGDPMSVRLVDSEQEGALQVLVGTATGVLLVLDTDGRERFRHTLSAGGAVRAADLSEGRLVVVSASGQAEVVSLDRPTERLQLGQRVRDARWVTLSQDDRGLRLLTDSDVQTWAVPAPTHPHRIALGAGIASLLLARSGDQWMATLGDGRVVQHQLSTGDHTTTHHLHDTVAKDVAESPDRTTWAIGHARRFDLPLINAHTGAEQRVLGRLKTRRVVWLDDGTLLQAPYAPGLWALRPDGGFSRAAGVGLEVADLEPTSDGRGAVLVDITGGVLRADPEDDVTLTILGQIEGATAVAEGGGRVLVGTAEAVHGMDGGRWATGDSPLLELAVSRVGDRVATAHLDGSVQLWDARTGARLAHLLGHDARAVALAFTPDGRWLLSGSWDETVRVWSLDSLPAPVR